MHTPEDYPKAIYMLQGFDTSMYLIVAVVIYRYAGIKVASPALGSTTPLLQKVAYGIGKSPLPHYLHTTVVDSS